MTIDDFIDRLPEGITGGLTVCVNGRPRVYRWMYQFGENGEFYFVTSNREDVYKQIKNNPYICFYTTADDETFAITGEAQFISSEEEKADLFNRANDYIQSFFSSAESPYLEIFYIGKGEVSYAQGDDHWQTIKIT